jgi:hypothetical protein
MTSNVIIERHQDGSLALADVRSAIRFHIETFGSDAFDEGQATGAFVAETQVA